MSHFKCLTKLMSVNCSVAKKWSTCHTRTMEHRGGPHFTCIPIIGCSQVTK